MLTLSYNSFRNEVRRAAWCLCEVPGCDSEGHGVHHFFKRSVHPELILETKNGMWTCGPHHTEIERLQRVGGDFEAMYPERYWEFKEEIESEDSVG